MRSAWRAATSITRGPVAATSTGTFGTLDVRQPLEPAREAVAVDGLAARGSACTVGEVALEARDRILRLADALHRRVAAADAEHGAPVALDLQRQRRRRGHAPGRASPSW